MIVVPYSHKCAVFVDDQPRNLAYRFKRSNDGSFRAENFDTYDLKISRLPMPSPDQIDRMVRACNSAIALWRKLES